MAKTVATAAAVVAVVATGGAALAGLGLIGTAGFTVAGSALGTTALTIGGTGIVGAIGAGTFAAVAAGAGLVASLASSAVPLDLPKQYGSATRFLIDPSAGEPLVMGRAGFAGALVHREAYGGTDEEEPNPYRMLALVYSSGGPVESLGDLYVEGEKLTPSTPFFGAERPRAPLARSRLEPPSRRHPIDGRMK